ncbi:MAG TPA: hypothetical protein VKY74_19530, partial [Chloroflexia bacterium]|nr:hypothetical protein [Chloroflexia bacterium]
GNLRLGEPQHLLLEIILPAVASGPVRLATCTLEWRAIDTRFGTERASYEIMAAVDARAAAAATLDPAVKVGVEKVMAYKLQKRAWQDVQEGNLVQATNKLRMVATRLLEAGEDALARTVQAEADNLERNGFVSASGTKQIKYGTRGLGRTRSMRAPGPVSGGPG